MEDEKRYYVLVSRKIYGLARVRAQDEYQAQLYVEKHGSDIDIQWQDPSKPYSPPEYDYEGDIVSEDMREMLSELFDEGKRFVPKDRPFGSW